ncbi:MAG: conjugal transfer protein TraG N-terminal domain-containing protein [Rhodocyclaceae bacterium]|nr:conjugal transfer protein TraG N-terminal domain-containing protein [Rhodocyclaceae bacterium]
MNFEVYAYWNTVELAGVFNAVAAITSSGDFNGLLRTVTLIMLLSLSIVVLAGRGMLTDMWKWIILVAIFNGIMLVPKSNVIIVDRVGSAPTQTVANVPLGLASTAHTISKIGDWLTTSFETVFALPNDLRFRTNGTLFGHRVQAEKLTLKIGNQIVSTNVVEFYRECVMPELALNTLTIEMLTKTNNLWSVLSQANNPARLVTLVDPTSMASSTIGCDQAVTALNSQLNTDASSTLTAEAAKFYPGLTQATATANLSSALQTTDQYQMGLSWAATDAIKQAQVANAVIDAQYLIPSQLGDAATAAVNLDAARAVRSTNQSYALMAKLASSTMPKVRNIIELTLYAIFPLVVLIIVAAGHYGGVAFRGYATSLIWVQLWPPLYAVMHYIMTLHSQELATATQGLGASLSQYAYVNDGIVTDQAIAGFMSATAIPGLAWALSQGMMSGVQGMVSAMGTATAGGRDVEKIGAAGGLGNRQTGSFSENTASYDTQTAHQYNTAPMNRHGAGTDMNVGANGIVTATAADGTVTVDASGIQHRTNFRMNMGSQATNSYQQQSEAAEAAAVGNAVSSGTAIATALQQSADLVHSHGKGGRAGTNFAVGNNTAFNQAVTSAEKIVDGFMTKSNFSQGQKAQIMAIAEASAGADIGVASVKATGKITGESDAEAKQTLEKARQYVKEHGFSEAMSKVRQTSNDITFGTSDESGPRAMAGIRASLDESSQRRSEASANHTRSLSLKESATRTRANSETFDAGMVRPFIEWMMTQDDKYNAGKFKPQTLAWRMEHDPMGLIEDKNRFFKEVIEPRLGDGVGQLKSPEDVQKFFELGQAGMPSASDINAIGRRQIGQVRGMASAAGVDPYAPVVSTVPGQVAAAENAAGQAIAAGRGEIAAQGKPLEKKAIEGTDPTRQNLLGNAAANAAGKVLPDGTTYLLDKAGVIPDSASVAKPLAERYQGDNWTASLESAAFLGSFFVGGPVAGKATGKLGELGVSWIAKHEGARVAEKAAASAVVKAEAGAAGRAAATEAGEAAARVAPDAAALIGPPTQATVKAAAKAEADLAARVAAEEAAAKAAAQGAGAAREAEILAGGKKAGQGVGWVIGAVGGNAAAKEVVPSRDQLNGMVPTTSGEVGKADLALGRSVGEMLPKPVDDVLEAGLNRGEQEIGKLVGTRPKGKPTVQAEAAESGSVLEQTSAAEKPNR